MAIPPSAERPPGVEPLTIDTRRGEVATLRAGETPVPDVLFVPGFTGSKEDFLPLQPLMAQRGWSSWAIDLPGQFESVAGGEHSLADWAEDVADIISAAGRPLHVVGHSFGGLISRECALSAPDSCASLVLLDSGPGPLPDQYHDRLQLLIDVIPRHSMAEIWEAKEALDRQDGIEPPPPEIQEFLHRRWVASDPAAFATMAHVLMTCPDRTEDLARVSRETGLRVAVMFGADDSTAWPPSWQREMAARLGCPAVAIRDAAHSPPTENPEGMAEALAGFLDGVGRRV